MISRLQPHEGSSETRSHFEPFVFEDSFNPTRVRLKRDSGKPETLTSSTLQPHEGSSETSITEYLEARKRDASTPRGFV